MSYEIRVQNQYGPFTLKYFFAQLSNNSTIIVSWKMYE